MEMTLTEYDADHHLIKQEMTHDGRNKVTLKEKVSGKVVERDLVMDAKCKQ